MIINLGDAPFKGFIRVTYPNGTCTVSLGDKSYTHSGGGTHTFEVNKKGTWTVSAVLGVNVARKEVEVTTRGGVTNVELHFSTLTIYNRGNEYLPLTLKNTINNRVSVDKGASYITVSFSAGEKCAALTTPVDLTNYKTLKVTYLMRNTSEKWCGICVSSTPSPVWRYDDPYVTANRWTHVGSGERTATYDVSSLKGTYYVGVFCAAYDANPTASSEIIYTIQLTS